MSTEIKIALITSITAMVVALISVLSSLLNNYYIRKQKKLINKELKNAKNIEAIDEIVISLQVFKDTLIYIIMGSFDDKEKALKKVINDIELIVKKYEEYFIKLEPNEKDIAHDTLHKVIFFGNTIKDALFEMETMRKIEREKKELFHSIRENITETQNILLESKRDKLEKD